MTCLKNKIWFFLVVVVLFTRSICFAASESAKNWMAAAPLIGGVLGGATGALFGFPDRSIIVPITIGAVVGFVGAPILAKQAFKNTEGINAGYVILGSVSGSALVGYLNT